MNSDRERHDGLARRTARLLNSISVPGVEPMSWRKKLTVLLVLGMAGALFLAMTVAAGRRS